MDDFTQDQNPQQPQQPILPATQPLQPASDPYPPQPTEVLYDSDQGFFGQQTNTGTGLPVQVPPKPQSDAPDIGPFAAVGIPQPLSPAPQLGPQPALPPVTEPAELRDTISPFYSPGKPGIKGGIVPEATMVPDRPKPAEIAQPEIAKAAPIEKQIPLEKNVLKPSAPVVETIKNEEPLIKPATTNKGPDKITIDKTKDVTRLHHLHPADKLTSIADAEEEEFIKDVEAAHGHK